MVPGEAVLIWIAISLYLVSTILFLLGFVFKKRRLPGYAFTIALSSFSIHTAAIILRWANTGHAPIVGDYENVLAGSWLITFLYIVVQLRYRSMRSMGIIVIPFVLLMLGFGITRTPQAGPLQPVFQSGWLFVHIFFAWLAYSSFVVAAILAVLFLLKRERLTTGANEKSNGFIPESGMLDELSYRFITLGFLADTFMLAAGAIWAKSLWGNYWSWEPVQTWSLLSWLIYGLYLHLRVVHGWRTKRAAWLVIIALPTVIISFFGISFITEAIHVFN